MDSKGLKMASEGHRPEQHQEPPPEPPRGAVATLWLIATILMGIWNNGSTIYNAKLLSDKGHG